MPIKGEMEVKIETLVTAEMLRKEGATCLSLSRFQAEWPNGAEITLENLLRAADLELDLPWWARHFLPTPLRAEFGRQVNPLWVEFSRQVAYLIWQLLEVR